MKRFLRSLLLAGAICWMPAVALAEKPLVLDVWPGKVPGEVSDRKQQDCVSWVKKA